MKKCSSCKVDNPDEAKFCRKCGKPLKKASSPFAKKLKDKRVIFTGTALAIAISGGVGFILYDNTPERRYQKNIAMAEKYLDEYNFEKAEEYLNVAKSIDPKKEDAYKELVKVYRAQDQTAKADTVISQAKQTLPTDQQSSFLSQLESLTEKASQIARESLEAQKVAQNSSTQKDTSNKSSSQNKNSSINNSSLTQSPNQENSLTTPSTTDEVVAVVERPLIDPKDLKNPIDEIDGESVTISIPQSDLRSNTESVQAEKELDQKQSVEVISTPQKEPEKPQPHPSIAPETQVISLPNTPYTLVAEIGSLEMAPIALNSDCWIVKKNNEFQFLFPDGSLQKLDSKDQLVLQANINSSGNTTLLSSACLIESSSKNSNQYYPKEEEVSSCLPNDSEIASYSLEGNYQNSSVPILVRSSNQSGYWIYNPGTKALYGPFKDSEDTSFYSKISHLSDITLVGHNGQIGSPYWIPAHTTVQKLTKNEKIPAISSTLKDSELVSKESNSVEDSKTSSEASPTETNSKELQIWSKDGKSYKTGYTNPKTVDWYSVGAFQDEQFHLLNENLEVVYAGPFDQGGSVIKSAAPVQINGIWKLVQFKNIPSSGPEANYSFTYASKEEKENEVASTSDQTTESSSEDKTLSDSGSSIKEDNKGNSSSSTQSNKNSSIEKEKSEISSSTEGGNYFLKNETSDKTTISSQNTDKIKSEDSSLQSTSIGKAEKSAIQSDSKKSDNYFLKDDDGASTDKTKANSNKETNQVKSETSSTQSKSSDKTLTSSTQSSDKGKTNYFEKEESNSNTSSKSETKSNSKKETNYFDKNSENSTENKSKTVTNNSDKEDKSVTASDKSSNKGSTSDTKKSSPNVATQNDKTSNVNDKDKDQIPSGLSKEDKTDTSSDKDYSEDSSEETSAPIYYSFPEFAGTYTVTGVDWSNSFKLHSDGSFEGEYTEMAETDNPELYPNGVIRICSYSGTFSLKNDRLKITSLSLEETPGEIGVEEGILYEYIGLSDSCMSQGEMFTLYGPGTPYSEFSTKASRWIPTPTTSATVDFIMVQDGASEFAYV